jgi:hypothetical protein
LRTRTGASIRGGQKPLRGAKGLRHAVSECRVLAVHAGRGTSCFTGSLGTIFISRALKTASRRSRFRKLLNHARKQVVLRNSHSDVAHAPSNVKDAAGDKSFTFIAIVIRNGMGLRAAFTLL